MCKSTEGYVLLRTDKKYVSKMAIHFIETSDGIQTEILSPVCIESFKRDSPKIRAFNSASAAAEHIRILSDMAKAGHSWAFAYDADMEEVPYLEIARFVRTEKTLVLE